MTIAVHPERYFVHFLRDKLALGFLLQVLDQDAYRSNSSMVD